MTKQTYSIIAVVAILVIAGFFWWSGMLEKPREIPAVIVPVDTIEEIQKDLDGIDIGNVDTEFKDVDETLKGL